MAKKKTTKSSEPEESSARLTELVERRAAELAGSVAATRVKEGWSFSPAMDLLWAAGWPDLHVLDPAPRADAVDQARALYSGQWEQGAMPVAKGALTALLRVQRDGGFSAQGQLDDRTEALFSQGEEWPPGELAVFVRARTHPQRASSSTGALRLSTVEPLIGASATAEAVLSALEAWSDDDIAAWCVDACRLVRELGFVLLRLRPDDHSTAMERLGALARRAVELWPHAPHELDSVRELGWLVATLELLVGGDRAALQRGDRIEGRLQQSALDFVQSPQLVIDACPGFYLGKWAYLHGRTLWLGGDVVLRWYRDQWKKFTAHNAHTRIVRVLGEVRSPIVTECMLAMASDSKAKKLARAWFASHRAYALETLPALADGAHSSLARAILDELE